MSKTPEQQKAAILEIMAAIVETVKDLGPQGAPGGHLYAALMGVMRLDQFEVFMGALVKAGKLVKRGECYFLATPKTPDVDEDRLGFGIENETEY